MSPSEACKILVVNDNLADLTALQAALEDLGENVVMASSGREALRAALREDFAVMLMDVNMPGLDGMETASLLRQREQTADVPIIFVTATKYSGATELSGYSLRAVDYIFTPVVPEVLRAKVKALLDLRRRERRLLDFERREHAKQMAGLRERRAEEVRRNRFFALSVDLMSVSGFDRSPRHVNPSWQVMLGYSPEEAGAPLCLQWVHLDDRATAADAHRRLLAGETLVGFEDRVRVKDGSYRWISWNACPSPEEELIYPVGRDITERKQAEQTLADLEGALAEANRELEAFAHSVSRDLRGSLRSIDGLTGMLAEHCAGQLGETARQFLERIRAAVRGMDQLSDDLLTLSWITRSELHLQEVDLGELARQVTDQLQAGEPQRQVEAVICRGLTARGDPRLLRILLEHLLGNASKSTARRADARIELGAQGGPVFFVRDNGAGFDPARANKLFERFEGLHGAEEFPGTGIGLATVERIVRRHGGRVWAERAVNQGATFCFTLAPGA